MVQLNDVVCEVLVISAFNPIHMRVDIEGAFTQRRHMRIVMKSDKLRALDDRLDTRVLPRLPI